jgi:hypothetical protein
MPDPTPSNDETARQLAAQLATAEQKLAAATAEAQAQKLRADTADGKLIELEKSINAMKGQVAAAQAAADTDALREASRRADAAEAKVAAFDQVLEKKVRERVELVTKAAIIMPELRMDKLDDRAIMSAIVKHCDAEADVSDGVPVGVIQGRFLAVTSARAESARAQARVSQILSNTDRADVVETRKQKKQDAWKQPLPSSKFKEA